MSNSSDEPVTPRPVTTPPPFTDSTTRNSLAWLAAGAPVDFTREISEHAMTSHSTRDSIPQPKSEPHHPQAISQAMLNSASAKAEVDTSVLPNRPRNRLPVKRKEVVYPSDLILAEQPAHTLNPATHSTDIELGSHGAAVIHPILANTIITRSNPRGPRSQKWGALIRKHWWW